MQQLIQFAITRKVTIMMFIAAILLLGIVSWTRTPVDLLPDITFPGAAVIAAYPGAGPEEVELYVTQVLEGALGTLTNVREIQSVSGEESARIVLLFNWGADMDQVAVEIREKLDQAARFLPDEVKRPTVYKFDPSMLPVMNIAVASDHYSLVELTRLGNTIAQRLERLEGVAAVTVTGGLQEEIAVVVDQAKLEQYQLPLMNVTNALRVSNLNIPGGHVIEEGKRWLIRTRICTETVDDIKNLVIGSRMETLPVLPYVATVPVLLQDVAGVSLQPQRQGTVNRMNGETNINLQVNKRSDANTVLTAGQIKSELKELAAEYPDINLLVIDDQSTFIEMSIASLIKNALLGGLLAFLILLFFLRNLRSTIIIALAIPISLVSTFILMYFAGLTINIMTLSGLALGVGMLVDNSIVVIENIFRHLQSSRSGKEAAFSGTYEVAMAITASTLTTVAVFLPVIFIGGMTGILFHGLALTVSFSLLASLLAAVTVVPMLSAILLRPDMGSRVTQAAGLGRLYRHALTFVLRRKLQTLLVAAFLFATSLYLIPLLGGEFLPALDEGTGSVVLTLPEDASLEETQQVAMAIEDILFREKLVEIISTTIGSSNREPILGGDSTFLSNHAEIRFHLKPVEERNISTKVFVERLKNRLPTNGAELKVSDISMTSGGLLGSGGIEVELAGGNLEQLSRYATRLQNAVLKLPFVESVENSLAARNPEVQVHLDMQKTMAHGISPVVAAAAIRSAYLGEMATRITKEDSEVAVIVTLQEEQRDSTEKIGAVMLVGSDGQPVRIDELATLERTTGPRTINRRDNQRVVNLDIGLAPGKDLLSAQEAIGKQIRALRLPGSYSASFRGQVLEMMEAFDNMKLAMVLAIALVYMVMASQFESLIHPLTVMFTLPLAAVGVLFTLFVTGHYINVPSMIGAVVLAGIVVNNAIVLVDYINQMRRRGMDVSNAVLTAGQSRLRPILMTTLTTVLGLIPLAVGTGSSSEIQRPLALTIMSGLVIGALLTLFVIPVIYTVFERLFPRATNIVREETP